MSSISANGKPCDATQELIAVGVCNVVNSLAQGFRGNGGIARGAVLNSSGVRTQMSNIYTGLIVIVALLYLTPAFFYIPKAALAAVIMAAVIFMIQYRVVKPMWRSKSKYISGFYSMLIEVNHKSMIMSKGVDRFAFYPKTKPKTIIKDVMG